MDRALFSKTGNAIWISHLDLMRVLQRAFRRAGMMLKHSQGFTPHPCLSIAMPLSVGVSSVYELMDFELDESDATPPAEIPDRLNRVLPEGIEIQRCYHGGRKLKELKWLEAALTLEYDNGVPGACLEHIRSLFRQDSLLVDKHSKNGTAQVDIIPMLHSLLCQQAGTNTLVLTAVVAAQNPTLNPLLLSAAIEVNLPEDKPDFVQCQRLCLYDAGMTPFV